MLLLDIEKEIRPLPRQEKLQLLRDIEYMLHENHPSSHNTDIRQYLQRDQEVGAYGPVNEPEIAKQLQGLLSS